MYELNEIERRLIERAEKKININYLKKFEETDYIEIDDLLNIIDALNDELDEANDKISDLEYDIENNYTLNSVDYYDEYGVSRGDFC